MRVTKCGGNAWWAAVALGWLLRVGPLLVFGPLRVPVTYDEGVYFSAAAEL